MPGPHNILPVSYDAEVDLSGSQWRVVVVGSGDNQMALPAGANASDALGILQDKPTAGETGQVMKLGLSWAIAAGNIARGDPLEVGNAAGAVKSGNAGTGTYLGTAEESAEDGQRFVMFINLIELAGSGFTFSSSSSSSSSNSSSSSSSSSST